MKKLLSITILLGTVLTAYSQLIKPSALNSGGKKLKSSSINMTCSIGEISIRNFSSTRASVQSGFLATQMNTFMHSNALVSDSIAGLNRAVNKPTHIFQVTPNPVTNWCVIIFEKDISSDYTITITDLSGRVLFSNPGHKQLQTTPLKLNLSNYQKGIYFVSLHSATYVQTVKIIKE